MTSVRGFSIVSAPCCGARYRKRVFGTINLCDRQRWSDGFWFAPLYSPPGKVCRCVYGSLFLSDEAEESAYVSFDEILDRKGEHPRGWSHEIDSLPHRPVLDHPQIAELMLAPNPTFRTEEIELELRLAFWHVLNHSFRAFCFSERWSKPKRIIQEDGHITLEELQGADDPVSYFKLTHLGKTLPWETFSEADLDDMLQQNLERLLPLLEKHRADIPMLLGEVNRALGRMDRALRYFHEGPGRMDKALTWFYEEHGSGNPEAARLIELAQAGERRVIPPGATGLGGAAAQAGSFGQPETAREDRRASKPGLLVQDLWNAAAGMGATGTG